MLSLENRSEVTLRQNSYHIGLFTHRKSSIVSNQYENWFSPFGGLLHILFGHAKFATLVSGGVHLAPARPTKVVS